MQIYFCIILTKDPHTRLVRRLLCRRFRVRFPKCNLKSLFRYLFFPCSSKSFYIGIFVKRSSDKEGLGMRLSFVSQNKDLYL